MKKNYQYLLVTIQLIISLFFLGIIVFSFIDIIRFDKDIALFSPISFSIFVQLFVYGYLAIELCQMNEPIRWSDSPLLHYVLLTLSLDGIIILPSFFDNINAYIFSPILMGKIHLFSIISSTIFLILCGINQKETNYKNSNHLVLFTISFSLFLTYFIKINNPTAEQPLNMFLSSLYFKIFFICLNIIAILSFIPSYLKDKTKHNKLKTYSYILFTISLGILRYNINLNLGVLFITLLLLIASSKFLIVNMKSYSI